MMRPILAASILLGASAPARSSDPTPVPLTRPALKQLLEDSKQNQPRLKAPEGGQGSGGGPRGLLPPELRGGYFMMDGRTTAVEWRALRDPKAPEPTTPDPSRPRINPDPNMTLDPAFKIMLFWIVSRANNCVYCMGHQEPKLTALGLKDDRIAALDADWSEFTNAERAAFALTKKLTAAPHAVTAADIDEVKKHYKDVQVQEMIALVAGYNAMNRWTGSLRLTQQDFREYLTPTSPRFEAAVSLVAPVPPGSSGTSCAPIAAPRPPLEPREEVQARWDEARDRAPRFALVDESAARALLPEGLFPTDEPLPNWVRLMTVFPEAGPARIAGLRASELHGALPPKLRAQLSWVSARADRSWYALDRARARLEALGVGEDEAFAIDAPDSPAFSPAEKEAFAFARKLTVDPALIEDDDFDRLRPFYSDAEIAELIHHVNNAVFLNLVTESAGLPLDR